MKFLATSSTILTALMIALLGGCQSPQAYEWSGNWSGNRPGYGGDLHCNVEQINDQDWSARFTGYCGRIFAYEVTMSGRLDGDKIVFSGEADLGEEDGGLYQWAGAIEGDTFDGGYDSTTGKQGTFSMTRQ